MDTRVILGIIIVLVALGWGAVAVSYLLSPRRSANLRSLMGASQGGSGLGTPSEERARMRADETGQEFERVKKATSKKVKKKVKYTPDELYFQAGIFSDKDKKEFQRLKLLIPCFTTVALAIGFSKFGAEFSIVGAIFGFLVGLQAPVSILDRKIKRRGEEIMYYLPLVIEQVAIGVSSSLDIGPCIQRIVSMADERDSHNVVTELVRHAQFYVKSGASLEDALMEVGRLSGHTELKHSFMALSQVARHGGEITRQLQELADAVASQRETKIEAKIKRLELEATAPVAVVFCGFLLILLVGFFIQIKNSF